MTLLIYRIFFCFGQVKQNAVEFELETVFFVGKFLNQC